MVKSETFFRFLKVGNFAERAFDNTTPEFTAYYNAHTEADVVDPRHVNPVILEDCDACPKYINKTQTVVLGFPEVNVEELINDMNR